MCPCSTSEYGISARQFAEALIDQTRAELDRLLKEHPAPMLQPGEHPCEPAD